MGGGQPEYDTDIILRSCDKFINSKGSLDIFHYVAKEINKIFCNRSLADSKKLRILNNVEQRCHYHIYRTHMSNAVEN